MYWEAGTYFKVLGYFEDLRGKDVLQGVEDVEVFGETERPEDIR